MTSASAKLRDAHFRHACAWSAFWHVVCVVAFVLLGLLSLIYNAIFWWLIVMGLVAGAGFFWALNPDETG